LGAIWSSSIFPGRAPDGKAAFTNILGGARKTNILEYNDNELIEMTLRDLRSILHIETKPEFVQVIRHSRAIPQYNIGHQGRIHLIEKGIQDIPGLYLAGNYLNGVSVGHCIAEATKLAAKIRDSM
ncbi:MAG: protoporphyrinogen oxidase, partial [Nitrospirota bacterium]|nr:protoporphyrinogen oxidase [Nitrospirota bacterium]